jgi:hypothetical protein
MEPVDHAHALECEHVSEIWSDVDDAPEESDLASDQRLVADGGRDALEEYPDSEAALRIALEQADHERERELIREALQLEERTPTCGGGSR